MLKQEFLDRKQRRPSYSERAFARDLRVSPSYVSLLFRGLRTLSPAKALEFGQRLGWSERKVEAFLSLIHTHNLKRAPGRRRQTQEPSHFTELDLDKFRFIGGVHHLAILSLVQSREVRAATTVASELNIPQGEAELALARLLRLGLITYEHGRFKPQRQNLEIKETPSEIIRALHRQVIEFAARSVDGQSVEERNLASLTLSFDSERIGEAKACITRFLKSFHKRFGHARGGEIYQMNTQFFRISKGKSK